MVEFGGTCKETWWNFGEWWRKCKERAQNLGGMKAEWLRNVAESEWNRERTNAEIIGTGMEYK